MRIVLALLSVALAGAAVAEEPRKNEAPKPALNLRLDDGSSAAPRINFDQPAASQTKDEREKGLPELGGKPSNAFDRKVGSGTNSGISSGVIPSAMDPNVNRE
jgi:hypothetical protein